MKNLINMNKKLFLTCGIMIGLLIACSKSPNAHETPKEGEQYFIIADNLASVNGKLVFRTSVQPSKTVVLKPGESKETVNAKIGEFVEFQVLLPGGGGVRVLDSKGITIAGFNSFAKPLSESQDLYFLAFDPNDPVKDPFRFKTGLAKEVADLILNKKLLLKKMYYLENGIETPVDTELDCEADNEYQISPLRNYDHLNPAFFAATVKVTPGADNCGGWPESESQSFIHPSLFTNASSAIAFPVFDRFSIEFPHGWHIDNLLYDSISQTNKTITFHRMINSSGKKEIFVYSVN
ncbi:MAG: hypothetical protein ABS67_01605 [Niabella sp. SCN 42-15]|nr:MAG: hypothetical protein ABS67_01605 [Niabella sp. SCN 42-15]